MSKYIMYLFFGVFAAAGVAVFYFSGFDMALQSMKAQSWQPVYAELNSYNLDVSEGDDSTTYQAQASYVYAFQGVRYSSNKVGFSKGYDNITSYHQDMIRRLAQISQSGESLPIWVNPESPNEAVIDRDIRWGSLLFGSLFLVLFGGVGFGGLYFTYATRNAGKLEEFADPSKPWTMYSEWNAKTRYSDAKLGVKVLLGFALFWNVLSLGGVFVAVSEVMAGNYLALLVLVFPLIGLFLISNWFKANRSFKLTGLAPLELNPFPGSLGGQVGGTVRFTNRDLNHIQAPKVEVFCINQYQQKRGKNSETRERVLWQHSMVPKPRMGQHGMEFSFSFDVPNDLPVPDPPLQSNRNMWRISLSGEAANGVKIERDYEDIPVFATAQKSSFRDRQAYANTSTVTQAAEQKLIETVVDVEQDAQGYTLDYPMFSNRIGFGVLCFGSVFIIAGVLIPSLVFNIVFPLLGGLVFLVGANMFLTALELRIDAHGISSQKSLLSYKFKQKFIPSYGLKGFFSKEAYSVSSGSKTTVYYNIEARGSSGEKFVVARKLEGQAEANAAIKKLELLTKSYS